MQKSLRNVNEQVLTCYFSKTKRCETQPLTYSSVRFVGGFEVRGLWVRASNHSGAAHDGTADHVTDHSFLLLLWLLLRAAVDEEVLHDQLTHPHKGG